MGIAGCPAATGSCGDSLKMYIEIELHIVPESNRMRPELHIVPVVFGATEIIVNFELYRTTGKDD